jgi:carbon monoxide dehydrogenase subunit G
MIEVNETIEVSSDPKAVWAFVTDPHAVVECVAGATLGERNDEGIYDAGIVVKFGPAKVAFRAKVEIEFHEDTMSGKVISRGKDKQGGARFETTMHFKITEGAQAGSTIAIKAEVDISGRLASLIETGALMVVKRMTKEFSEQLAVRLAGVSTA